MYRFNKRFECFRRNDILYYAMLFKILSTRTFRLETWVVYKYSKDKGKKM